MYKDITKVSDFNRYYTRTDRQERVEYTVFCCPGCGEEWTTPPTSPDNKFDRGLKHGIIEACCYCGLRMRSHGNGLTIYSSNREINIGRYRSLEQRLERLEQIVTTLCNRGVTYD